MAGGGRVAHKIVCGRLPAWRLSTVMAGLAALWGCASDRFSPIGGVDGQNNPAAAAIAPTGKVTAAPLDPPGAGQTAMVDMSGRWFLAASGVGMCAMTFNATPGAAEGGIAPEGGCPGNFFTSRTWALVEGTIVIKDHNGEQLVQLSPSNTSGASIWFEGQAATGERVMLARQ